ncbi:DeoR family transcriptional regulator [Streptomyces inhibens]|uniref:DeoR family transcriptional regulator n=1 Tax=Streptomyces inhibens TaxID=2293571 RepID=UPI0037BB6C8A
MTDTEGAADVSVATDAPVTELSPGDRRKRIAGRVPAEGQVTIEELVQELGVSQMTVHRDLDTLEHQGTLRIKRALMAAARRKVLLVDHSKFGRQALYELAPPAGFDLVISDEQLPQEEQDALQSLGVRYELATEGSRRV